MSSVDCSNLSPNSELSFPKSCSHPIVPFHPVIKIVLEMPHIPSTSISLYVCVPTLLVSPVLVIRASTLPFLLIYLTRRLPQRLRRPHLPAPKNTIEHLGQHHRAISMLLGKSHLGIPAAPVPRRPHRLPQQLLANAALAELSSGRPRADHTLPSAQTGSATLLLTAWRGSGAGLEAQDEGADNGTVALGTHGKNHVVVAVLRDKPAPAKSSCSAEVADRGEVDGEEVGGDEGGSEEYGGGDGTAETGILVDTSEEAGKATKDKWVLCEGEGGLLALLGNAIGDELEGVEPVVFACEKVEG